VSNPSNPAEPEKAPPGYVSDPAVPAEAVPAPTVPAPIVPASTVRGAPLRGAHVPAEPNPEDEADEAIDRLGLEFVEDILDAEPGGSDLVRIVSSLERLGDREFLASAAMSGRVLDRRFHAIDAALLGSHAPMARQLADLRKVAARIDPGRLKLGGKRSADDEIHELDRYFERFGDVQPRLQEILDQLNEGRFLLEQDNAAIAHEESSLAAQVETLRRFALLAARIDDGLAARLDSISATDPARADSLRVDVLAVVRRRRQEVLTQQAIAMQGLSALHIVRDNNVEVIRAVASAVSTTTAAIRTAVMTAQAAASQRIALGHVRAANLAASAMADHAAVLEAETSGPGGRVAMLKQAWSDVYAALDRVDEQKAQALRTIADADRELTRPKPGLSGRR
jgi:uncharacterized protein YaaN involved in tellurite resistance